MKMPKKKHSWTESQFQLRVETCLVNGTRRFEHANPTNRQRSPPRGEGEGRGRIDERNQSIWFYFRQNKVPGEVEEAEEAAAWWWARQESAAPPTAAAAAGLHGVAAPRVRPSATRVHPPPVLYGRHRLIRRTISSTTLTTRLARRRVAHRARRPPSTRG